MNPAMPNESPRPDPASSTAPGHDALTHPAPASPQNSLTIKLIAIGGAGLRWAQTHGREFSGIASISLMDTDEHALATHVGGDIIQLGARLNRGLGAGGDPRAGFAAAQADAERIKQCCSGADVVLLVGGLGGGTASGASSVVARHAIESGALTMGLFAMPFDCELDRRQAQARQSVRELKLCMDGLICLPNQAVCKMLGEQASLMEVFKITNQWMNQAVHAFCRLLTSQGLIPLSFADIRSVLRNSHAESTVACAEAVGEHRARDVVQKLLAHPVLDDGKVLADAGFIVASVVGGPDLSMAEINRVVESLRREAFTTPVHLGAAVEESMSGRLSVALMVARNGIADPGPSGAVVESEPGVNSTGSTPTNAGTWRQSADLDKSQDDSPRPASRFVAPPPPVTPETTGKILERQQGTKRRKSPPMFRQATLPLDIISKGRFDKSEPTIHQGEDLDIPTYIRRGVALN